MLRPTGHAYKLRSFMRRLLSLQLLTETLLGTIMTSNGRDSVTELANALLKASVNKDTGDISGDNRQQQQHSFLFDPTGRIGGHHEDADHDDVDSISGERTLRVSTLVGYTLAVTVN